MIAYYQTDPHSAQQPEAHVRADPPAVKTPPRTFTIVINVNEDTLILLALLLLVVLLLR